MLEGYRVGKDEGNDDGSLDGLLDATGVGPFVRLSDGPLDGNLLGLPDGIKLGGPDG